VPKQTMTEVSAISLRIDLPNGSRLGPGKVALLEAVKVRHSISAAARQQGMSYRRAWLLIDDMNRAFQDAVVKTFPGRSQAAGASLTPFGERLVALYRAAESHATYAITAEVAGITSVCDRSYGASGGSPDQTAAPAAKAVRTAKQSRGPGA